MIWSHQVSPAWLSERKKYLTASDIKKLIPVTATGRPRQNIEEAVLKVWADKQCAVTQEDVQSFGQMARGHLLEPYAIKEFNRRGVMWLDLRHWDDMLIHTADGVACSPDALDVPCPADGRVAIDDCQATVLGEVKAYNAGAHYVAGLADKMVLEDRWQIATAFYVIPTLEAAALILFNPAAEHPLFQHIYIREELADEIKMVGDVVRDYKTLTAKFESSARAACPPDIKESCPTEDAIVEELVAQALISSGLNP